MPPIMLRMLPLVHLVCSGSILSLVSRDQYQSHVTFTVRHSHYHPVTPICYNERERGGANNTNYILLQLSLCYRSTDRNFPPHRIFSFTVSLYRISSASSVTLFVRLSSQFLFHFVSLSLFRQLDAPW